VPDRGGVTAGAGVSTGFEPRYWWRKLTRFLLLPLFVAATAAQSQVTLTEGTNLAADVAPSDGRIAMDLLGSIWIVPPGGGAAEKISNGLQPAVRPQWSPRGDRILYQTISALGSRMWLFDTATSTASTLSDGSDFDQHPSWHPSGERIVFSSAREASGFDLWEMHLETGLSWRLSHAEGDETEPAWSTSGRDLAYIRYRDDQWRLVLRRHGQREQDLLVSDEPLAAPSWRPDGSLLTVLQRGDDQYSLKMVILSDPPLVRTLVEDKDFFLSPVSWTDRMRFFYTADGVIWSRGFNDWKSSKVRFRAEVRRPAPPPGTEVEARRLPVVSPSGERLVIRAARLFDGVRPGYRRNMDVLIQDGRVAAVEPERDWEDVTVLDLGDATMLPGFIDSYAALPDTDQRVLGLVMLSYGVTTVVAEVPQNLDPLRWETEESPGPRLLQAAPLGTGGSGRDEGAAPLALQIIPASGLSHAQGLDTASSKVPGLPLLAESWRVGVAVGADMLIGADTMPASPRGNRYQDVLLTVGSNPQTFVSGLADAGTPALAELFQSRQARVFDRLAMGREAPPRRLARPPNLAGASSIVVGSKPNALPPGLALHAELQALASAGLSGDLLLRAVGANAADALGFRELGRIEPGAMADLVLVAGDPGHRILDALNIVAVVRNGRFFSLVRLLEEAASSPGVE
jgi:Amidohydrolase family/WD40-like Beta Propeller Repeat